MKRFLFVGESPSLTARRNGWTWRDGRLAAKQLFDALHAADIDPGQQDYINLFTGPACRVNARSMAYVAASPFPVIALGRKVERALSKAGIAHTFLIHPSARGRIRKKQRYLKHVRNTLEGVRHAKKAG